MNLLKVIPLFVPRDVGQNLWILGHVNVFVLFAQLDFSLLEHLLLEDLDLEILVVNRALPVLVGGIMSISLSPIHH